MYVLHNYSYVDYVLGKHTEYGPALTYVHLKTVCIQAEDDEHAVLCQWCCAQTHFQRSTILRGVQGREWVWSQNILVLQGNM